MNIIYEYSMIWFLEFKRFVLYIDYNTPLLFIDNMEYDSTDQQKMLLRKFRKGHWDILYHDDIDHFKFLIKNSSILSKLVDNDEFDEINYVQKSLYSYSSNTIFDTSYYLNLKNQKKFFERSIINPKDKDDTFIKHDKRIFSNLKRWWQCEG